MSAISGKVLVSPFTNKVHLATILVVSIAFGVLRLSGGGVKLAPARHERLPAPESRMQVVPERSRQEPATEPGQAERPAAERPTPYKAPAHMLPTEANDAVLNDLMNSRKAAREKKPAAPSGGLEDIEKSLGLR